MRLEALTLVGCDNAHVAGVIGPDYIEGCVVCGGDVTDVNRTTSSVCNHPAVAASAWSHERPAQVGERQVCRAALSRLPWRCCSGAVDDYDSNRERSTERERHFSPSFCE